MSQNSLRRAQMYQTRRSRAIANALALLLVATVAVPARGTDPIPVSGPFGPAGSLSQARTDHTATLLPDGRVLVLGGEDGGETLASAELWSPDTGSFLSAGSLVQARKWHTATLLPDGRVLIVGGLGNSAGGQDDFLASAEIWDPATGEFAPTGSMTDSRIHHTATLLPDGRVLAVAGIVLSIASLASAELWDPATDEWTRTGSLKQWRADHTATLLDDGQVLVIGGGSFTADGFKTFKRAEIWNPAKGAFRPAGRLARPRLCHSSTRLPDGRVLVVGGLMNRAKGEAVRSKVRRSAEVWNPTDRSSDPVGPLTVISGCNTAGLLLDGRVLVVGSGDTDPEASETAEVAETWDPTTGSFSPAGSLIGARSGHTVTILPDGRALVIGGVDEGGDYLVTAEIYDPSRSGSHTQGD
jgi:hypothetical protein